MMPPKGYRGALTGWPQLVSAIDRISSDPAAAAKLSAAGASAGGLQLGSNAALVAALAVHPAMLRSSQPPAEIYAQCVWFIAKQLAAARRIEKTLAQISSTAADPQGLSQEGVGAMAAELLNGEGGLSQLAGLVTAAADEFVRRLSALGGALGLHQALADFKTAGANVEQRASAAAGREARDLVHFHVATIGVAQSTRVALDELEFSAAAVSAAAVLENLTAVMRSLAAQWKLVSGNLAAAVATANRQQLGDPDYLRQSLGLDDAAAWWKTLADLTEFFIQKSLTATP